jgi:hypothetical protein
MNATVSSIRINGWFGDHQEAAPVDRIGCQRSPNQLIAGLRATRWRPADFGPFR